MKNIFRSIKGIRVLKKTPLSRYTSFHIGGYADYLITVHSKRALRNVFEKIKKYKIRYFILGAGTNLLVADSGFRGVVIKLGGAFKQLKQKNNQFICGAGLLLDKLLEKTADRGYQGAEFLAGIPGTVGGAVKGNAGAFGKSISQIVESITIFDGKNFKELKKESIKFGYRFSSVKNGVFIIQVKVKLRKSNRRSVTKKMAYYKNYRKQRQPDEWSAGSFFKNPPEVPAGKLIEQCGLKGLRIGDAEVSNKHANFIINRGQATAEQVIALAQKIKRVVKNKKGVTLREEVRLLK
ncbi:UDP-N-acetylenolpyruvoylglucosamine reductase [candidate division WOR-3 bacterium 4484_100]|uniref:UDP-N-acetylenolpyruvoylglucosamine reductase n=1 Tax=candidate division WOR-3 bacterium 4484_100 TaxID=1936077 RepID=A0A1V4QEL3_UNCW3|nr:MAG: UDP-N-acetylenolpyruvoylglucosamine reductase [candidate division WOR-3 bacterium 4484_100]